MHEYELQYYSNLFNCSATEKNIQVTVFNIKKFGIPYRVARRKTKVRRAPVQYHTRQSPYH